MNLETMQSILRDMFRGLPSYVATSDVPEEIINRPTQYPVSRGWDVETVESFSLPEDRKTDPKHIWKCDLPCISDSLYKNLSIEFTHFIDGVQRTSRVREILWQTKGNATVPLLIAQLASIVLRRENRTVSYCDDISDIKILIEVPIQFLIRNAREDVAKIFQNLQHHHTFQWLDTSYATIQVDKNESDALQFSRLSGYYKRIPDKDFRFYISDPNWLNNHSRKWTTKYRDVIEQKVFDDIADKVGKATKDGKSFHFIVKDGTLTSKRGKIRQTAVGISKSFNTRFLEPHLQNRVVNLIGYHRTPVFKFQRDAKGTEPDQVESEEPRVAKPETHTVATWYLRIRQIQRGLPYWGLVRIEIDPNLLPSKGSSDRWDKSDSQLVSAISTALVAEASPTSHPDPRWHNLLYPIKLCEKLGRSKMVPHETVKCLFNWGGAFNG